MKSLCALQPLMILFLIFLILPGSWSQLQAQDQENIRFDHPIKLDFPLTVAFMQDSDGFFWIGTQNGLVRYDGYEQKVYRTGPNSISNDSVVALVEDHNGAIWIGTQGGGLDRYDKETNTFTNYRHDPDNSASLSSDIISYSSQPLYIDSAGTLWAGTQRGGLNKFDSATDTFVHYKHDPENPQSLSDNTVQSIIEDGDGVLWIGTEKGGLNKFDRKNESFTHYRHDPINPKSIGEGWVYALLQDPDDPNILWIGTVGGGLNKFDKTTKTFIHYSHDPAVPGHLSTDEVLALCADEAGRLWIASWRTPLGLSLFDRHTETFIGHYVSNPNNASGLTTDNVVSLYIDHSGTLWLGHLAGAVDTHNPAGQKFGWYQHAPQNPNSLSSNIGVPYYEDREDTIWIGTADGGLNRYEPETDTFRHYQHDPQNPNSIRHNFITHIFEDSRGTFWLGTRGGTLSIFDRDAGECTQHYQHDPEDPESIPQHDSIRAILEDRDDPGILWFGAFWGGFFQFNTHSGVFTNYPPNPDDANSLNSDSVLHLYQDGDGIIWLSTMGGGVNRFDKTTGIFTRYTHIPDDPQSIGSNQIMEVHEYTPGVLWIATNGGGLNIFDTQAKTFTRYTKETGFPANTVLTIRQDDRGNLWMGTDEGLVKFHPESGETKVYKKSDGLQGDVFLDQAALKTHDGELWFGGVNGVNRFDPEKLRDNPYIPPVVVTSFKQGGEEMALGKAPERVREITLDWQHNFFEFEFAALNYTKPEKNQYAYMLEGFDNDWYYAGTRRFGRYANLPGGTYTLRVKGSNNDGIWNEEGTSIVVNVGAPFWATWWFYTLGILAISGLVGFIYYEQLRTRTSRLKAEHAAALAEKEAALHEAAEREKEAAKAANRAKSVFLANMSHEIRTPMNAVLGFAELLSAEISDPKHKMYVDSIQSSGKNLLSLINDILDLSKVEAGKLELHHEPCSVRSLFQEITQIFSFSVSQKGLEFRTEIDPEIPDYLLLDEVHLRQVLVNLFGNAIKFTEHGTIKLSANTVASLEKQYVDLLVSVEDTGIGISPEDHELIFDVFQQQTGQRAKDYGGTGLGLAISKQLVEMMGGSISVTSKIGKGSRFEIRLSKCVVASAPVPSEPETSIACDHLVFEETTILVVDDIATNRQIITAFLQKLDVTIIEAENGQEAVQQARKHHPTLILMDLKMPEMDGYEALRTLRSDEATRTIPVIALTASAMKEDQEQVKQHGFDDSLLKPIERAALFETLCRFLPYSEAEPEEAYDMQQEEPGQTTTLSPETQEHLPDLLDELEHEMMKQWERVRQKQRIPDIEEFGKQMKALGEQYGIPNLSMFGEELLQHVNHFDIDQMRTTLENYPRVVQCLLQLQA